MNYLRFVGAFFATSKVVSKRHLLSALFSFSAFSIAIMGESQPAYAWFKICNQSTQTVYTAFAYEDVNAREPDIFGVAPPQRTKGWNSEGWWTLESGQCAEVYPHDLRDRNSYYYVYAKGNSGGVWEGDNKFCVVPGSAFTVGSANHRCGGRGDWRNFREVNVGNSRNYTYRLTE